MRTFDEIFGLAVRQHGSTAAIDALLSPPPPAETVAAIPAARWLAGMTRAIFNAGFNWKVIDAKWDGFEVAFRGFNVGACAMMDDAWFDRLVADTRIVRNAAKIQSVRDNAVFLQEIAADAGSPGAFFAGWPSEDFVGLLEVLKTRASRLGGTSGQYFLRSMGVPSFILSKDVVARLVEEGVIEKAPTTKKAMAAVQEAFNTWCGQSRRSLSEVSRVLAMSMG